MIEDYIHFKAIKIPLYPGKLVIVLSNSCEKVKELLPAFDRSFFFASTWPSAYKGKKAYFIVINFHNGFDKVTHGTIAHECVHATNMVLDDVGIHADLVNDEAQAYLLTWMVDQVHKFAEKNNFKI